jgi:hypothetical protein
LYRDKEALRPRQLGIPPALVAILKNASMKVKCVFILCVILMISLDSCMIDNVPAVSEKKISIDYDFKLNISKLDLLKKSQTSRSDLNTFVSNIDDSIFYLSFYAEKYYAHVTSSVLIRELSNKTTVIHVDSIDNIFVRSGNILFSNSAQKLRKIESLDKNAFIDLIRENLIDKVNAGKVDSDIFIDNKKLVDSLMKK